MNLVSSTWYFEDTNTNIIFLNNTATDLGGAIYFAGPPKLLNYRVYILCFTSITLTK